MRPYYTKILLSLFLLISVTFCLLPKTAAGQETYRVTRVYDGDTIAVRKEGAGLFFPKEEKVRLIGIDAPEIRQEPWGRRAKRRMKKLISRSGSAVSLQFDLERRDKYGRLLAYVTDNKGRMLNEAMLEEGYAVLYTIPPNLQYAGRFRQAQRAARRLKKGIWGKRGLREKPSEWRREHPRR